MKYMKTVSRSATTQNDTSRRERERGEMDFAAAERKLAAAEQEREREGGRRPHRRVSFLRSRLLPARFHTHTPRTQTRHSATHATHDRSLAHLAYPIAFPANKKANLINGPVPQQPPNGSPSSNASSDEYQSYQAQFGGSQQSQSRSGGPNLVNKQLVLPFVPPSFPNGSTDGSNHLIKPSEYLKSISDKRSSPSSAR